MDALRLISTRRTSQSEQADPRQVRNLAGGFTFELDDVARLRRFLTLGVDGGTYYASARDLAIAQVPVLQRMARTDPQTLVATIVDVSARGAAPRQQPALFALAYAASVPESAPAALAALPLVARTGTHLFAFAGYVEQFRGWGRGLRRAVGHWYLDKGADAVAYQAVKYRQREGWSHRDLLRLAHPVPTARALTDTFAWIVSGSVGSEVPRMVEGFVAAQRATDAVAWAGLVREFGLTWEMLPDAALGERDVWDALLDGMPPTALMRQLPRLTRLGLLPEVGGRTAEVCARLTDPDRLRRARVHPISVLVAQRTYASGHSARGAGTWQPTQRVVDALDAAFYAAFGVVEPSATRTMLAVDVSGSMGMAPISGMPITPREASAALALVQLATEPEAMAVGFSASSLGWHDRALKPLRISPRQRLDDALAVVDRMPMGGTDCALPMIHARQHGLEIDTFMVYTDNETWAGEVHPHQALRAYRESSGIAARLVVVGMTATQFTIADPSDAGMLDVAGFDAAVPSLISQFARGI